MLASADNVAEIQDAVRGAARIIPVSGGSKPALCGSADDGVTILDVSGLSGLVEYDPAELTFTAHAATPVAEVSAALAEHGQYLPFDPPLAGAGATLAGVVAAGTSGANAFRHGGVRDFVIGTQIVDGQGRLVSGGGKVVKNAAGFDLPKLMVGSLGRLGVMVRLSFKVFPAPRATTTLAFDLPDPEIAIATICALARGPLGIDALDLTPEGTLLVRLGGDREVLDARARRCGEIVGALRGGNRPSGSLSPPESRWDGEADREVWQAAGAFAWVPEASEIIRVPVTPETALLLLDTLRPLSALTRLSLGANLAWIAWPRQQSRAILERRLTKLGLRGMRLDGSAEGPPLLGGAGGGAFATRIAAALDPDHRFLEF